MKRFLALFIAAVLAVSVLTACGSEAQKSQSEESQSQTVQDSSTISSQENQKLSGKITVNTTHSNLVDTVLKDLAQKFMDENPGTEIVFQAIPDANQVLKIKMASSSLDDITMVLPETKSSDFEKYFVPLDDLDFTKDNLYFYETGLGTDGKLYKIDGLISYSGIAYNKKVFEECGITEVPKTWDDFYKVCEKIKAKGITPISTSFKDGWPLQFWTDASFPFQNTGNANYFNELTDKDEILSEDSGILAGLKALRSLNEKGFLDNDLMSASWEGFRKDFPQGKFAMTYTGSWYPPQFVEKGGIINDMGMFPVPGTKSLYISSDWYYAIAANTKNMDLAKAFMKWGFLDPKIMNAIGVASAIKGQKISDPCTAELMSYGLPVIEAVGLSDNYNTIKNKAQLDFIKMAQDYIVAKNPDEVVAKYNNAWANAKKAVAK